MVLRIGSLFSGYGGLDLGVMAAIPDSEVVWHADIDKDANRILAHHWPDVPNLGDVSAVDWADVPPIDILTGGFPCQDVSTAGKRAGLTDGTRSGLWAMMADAVDHLRPSLVIIENVRGLLSARADSNLEPCPYCVGEGSDPPLRALGAVLGDLADLGYDARWATVRASDVGACHRRERVFIVGYPADPDSVGSQHGGNRGIPCIPRPTQLHKSARPALLDADPDDGRRLQRDPGEREPSVSVSDGVGDSGSTPAESDGVRRNGSVTPRGRGDGSADHSVPPADAGGERYGGGQDPRRLGHVDGEDAGQAQQRQRAREVSGHRGTAPIADAVSSGRDGWPREPERGSVRRVAVTGTGQDISARAGRPTDAPDTSGGGRVRAAQHGDDAADTGRGWGHDPADVGQGGSAESVADSEGHEQRESAEPGQVRPEPRDGDTGPNWGAYADAVHRWERVLGRPAPPPTEQGSKGGHRLSPAFVEWMMGLPEGHVTGVGVARTGQLKALGNGVVPLQACAAVRLLLDPD